VTSNDEERPCSRDRVGAGTRDRDQAERGREARARWRAAGGPSSRPRS
jgi:hypothetical protein